MAEGGRTRPQLGLARCHQLHVQRVVQHFVDHVPRGVVQLRTAQSLDEAVDGGLLGIEL